jgi:hypothetical protein
MDIIECSWRSSFWFPLGHWDRGRLARNERSSASSAEAQTRLLMDHGECCALAGGRDARSPSAELNWLLLEF